MLLKNFIVVRIVNDYITFVKVFEDEFGFFAKNSSNWSSY